MNLQKTFQHVTAKTEYTITLIVDGDLRLHIAEKFGLQEWQGVFNPETIMEISTKTGYNLPFQDFWSLLIKALEQKDIACYVDVLSSQDLLSLKQKSSGQAANPSKNASKSNKRYLILTYMANEQKYHYPLALVCKQLPLNVAQLKEVYRELRVQLEAARAAALNDTAKTDNSFSINYESKKNAKNQSKLRQIDQHRSQNEILKAKLARLQEQIQKRKVNIEVEAAIQRTKQLKQAIETANLDLVDWKNNVTDQEERHIDLKKELNQLHKKICSFLTTEKEMNAKKKGEEVEKELNQVRNHTKKNQGEVDRLKKDLETTKARVKEFQMKAKKLNSEKQVLRRGGRRGPYSSAGSVRSYNSYNSFGSSKRSYNSGVSSSKPRSNYSYSPNRFR